MVLGLGGMVLGLGLIGYWVGLGWWRWLIVVGVGFEVGYGL